MDQELLKGLTFRNKNVVAEEFYTLEALEGKTFDQIALDLWERMRRKKPGAFRADVGSGEHHAVRQSAKFSYKPPNNAGYQPINGARAVIEFVHETGVKEIQYFFEPIGGSGVEAFARHAREVADRPRAFGAWRCERGPDGSPRLSKVILDVYRRVVHVYVEPGARYPEAPPVVMTSPSISDPCFIGGRLHWAYAGVGQVLWSDYAASANPLAELLDELRRKYHVF
jgi:hypothetical protein